MPDFGLSHLRQSRWSTVFVRLASVLGLIYLLAILLGWSGGRRLGATETIIFAVILVFNSDLLDRLETFKVSPTSLEGKLKTIESRQDQQQNLLDSLRFLMKTFVTDQTFGYLVKLASENDPVPYTAPTGHDRYLLRSELRSIRLAGLVKSLPNKKLADLPESGDLRDFIEITDSGREYVKLRPVI